MILSQKRSCAGCKAYPYDSWETKCQLDVSIEASTKVHGLTLNFKPLDKCYKPMTIQNFIDVKGTIWEKQ